MISRQAEKVIFITVLFVLILGWAFLYWDHINCDTCSDQQSGSNQLADPNIPEDTINKNQVLSQNNLPDSVEKKKIKILHFGDLMIDRHVKDVIDSSDMDYLFAKIDRKFFEGYDIVGANLEGAVTDEGAHYAPVNSYDFAFAPERVEKLKDYNFNFFTSANNHFSDQGERGIIETRNNLASLGFFYVGCKDRRVDKDCSAYIIDKDGFKLGVAGFSMVYGVLDMDKVKTEIDKLRDSSDLVMVNIHWGVEYEHFANSTQREMAKAMIDAGADIIIGHHPHVIQGVEIYNDRPIFYSLGNFIFDQYFSEDTQTELGVAIEYQEGVGISIELIPIKSKKIQIEITKGTEKDKILRDIAKWSFGEDLKEDILDAELRF